MLFLALFEASEFWIGVYVTVALVYTIRGVVVNDAINNLVLRVVVMAVIGALWFPLIIYFGIYYVWRDLNLRRRV